jgi:hypothetical protein
VYEFSTQDSAACNPFVLVVTSVGEGRGGPSGHAIWLPIETFYY